MCELLTTTVRCCLSSNVCFGRLCVVTGTSPDETTVLGPAVLRADGAEKIVNFLSPQFCFAQNPDVHDIYDNNNA